MSIIHHANPWDLNGSIAKIIEKRSFSMSLRLFLILKKILFDLYNINYHHPFILNIAIDGLFIAKIILFSIVSIDIGSPGALYFWMKVGSPFFLWIKSNNEKVPSIEKFILILISQKINYWVFIPSTLLIIKEDSLFR